MRAGRLYTYPGQTTEKGCGSLSAQENRIYALLRGARRIGRAGGDVQLIDAAGSIVIRRANRPASAGPAARLRPTRYAGTALSLNGEPTQNETEESRRLLASGEGRYAPPSAVNAHYWLSQSAIRYHSDEPAQVVNFQPTGRD